MRDVVKNTKLTEECSKETIKRYVDEVIPKLTLEVWQCAAHSVWNWARHDI